MMSLNDSLIVPCPRCADHAVRVILRVGAPEESPGKHVQCNSCGHSFVFPPFEGWACNFACFTCKMYINAGDVWSYVHLVEPGIIGLGDVVEVKKILEADSFWAAPSYSHAQWLHGLLTENREFLGAHHNHDLRFGSMEIGIPPEPDCDYDWIEYGPERFLSPRFFVEQLEITVWDEVVRYLEKADVFTSWQDPRQGRTAFEKTAAARHAAEAGDLEIPPFDPSALHLVLRTRLRPEEIARLFRGAPGWRTGPPGDRGRWPSGVIMTFRNVPVRIYDDEAEYRLDEEGPYSVKFQVHGNLPKAERVRAAEEIWLTLVTGGYLPSAISIGM